MAAPVVINFMFDAGTSILFALCWARLSPHPVVTHMLMTASENVGSEIIVWTASSALIFLAANKESVGCPYAKLTNEISSVIIMYEVLVIMNFHLQIDVRK